MFLPEGILTPPQSINISFNGVANLKCTAVSSFIYWEINGQPTADLRGQGFQDTTETINETLRSSTQRVEGSHVSNNASLVCIAVLSVHNDHSKAKSDPAFIQVQG